jgi:hypothetical protein
MAVTQKDVERGAAAAHELLEADEAAARLAAARGVGAAQRARMAHGAHLVEEVLNLSGRVRLVTFGVPVQENLGK